MFMLITYDVEAKRTDKFKKLLRRYLNHDQYSVFTGDITDAQAIKLRRELGKLMIPGDRVTQISAANRQNVEVNHLSKGVAGKGELKQTPVDDHRRDFSVL
ncbi:CRISPR-associated endonuclease Cas2 [Thiothrix fructosivorans]|uniref:CRISPR-associated endoribonuclease Cas2 n=2 Tax=Thiothrix fructosivorans TaxID=111770 RepID=A0A8B0SLD1_9GAMM|nr:CRISPR-associated endonuclease Cas2 [Thiothrix fructosivorans]MBO0611506.1 CRISPR-associated endonuclease Cas2 [Thiothrix fructosivorans]QTX13073.1 CRISPR-associated endonuclease Cas2 [Thiothrix fructosivorans]